MAYTIELHFDEAAEAHVRELWHVGELWRPRSLCETPADWENLKLVARRIAALYDIHGNLPALKAALDEAKARDCDAMVFGGDVASGYMPAETLSLLMALRPQARFVMGNADRELIQIWDGSEPPTGFIGDLSAWAARQLNRQQRDFLASFEPLVEYEVVGLRGSGPALRSAKGPRGPGARKCSPQAE